MKGDRLLLSIGDLGKTFDNKGIIQGREFIKGAFQGTFRNSEKTKENSGGELIVADGNLFLDVAEDFQNLNLMAASEGLTLQVLGTLHSLPTGRLFAKNLNLESQGDVLISHGLGQTLEKTLNSLHIRGKIVEVEDIKALKSIKIKAEKSLNLKKIFSEQEGVFLKGSSVISQGIETLKSIFVKALQKLTLKGTFLSHTEGIKLITSDLEAGEASFKAGKEVSLETKFYKGIRGSAEKSQFHLKTDQVQGLESLKEGLGDLDHLTLYLDKGLQLDQPVSLPWNIQLEIPKESPKGLTLNAELEANKGLSVMSLHHPLHMGREATEHSPALTGFLKTKGHLSIKTLSLLAPMAKLYGGTAVTIQTKNKFQLGGYQLIKKKWEFLHPIAIFPHLNPHIRGYGKASFSNVPGKISNGSYVVSNENLTLECGELDLSYSELRSTGDLFIQCPKAFNNLGGSLFVGGKAHIKSESIDFKAETFRIGFQKFVGRFYGYNPSYTRANVELKGMVPYTVSPIPSIRVGGDLYLEATREGAIFSKALSVAGKIDGAVPDN